LRLFQSTPPRGGDFRAIFKAAGLTLFQSTPPRGGDLCILIVCNYESVSIHAPARGRRLGGLLIVSVLSFNPRPRAGATGKAAQAAKAPRVSIHAPARGRRVSNVADSMP